MPTTCELQVSGPRVEPAKVPALALYALAGAACACSGPAAELPAGVHAFDGTDVAQPTGDLAPLWELIGDARLIGLGESIHTSGGFYATKHRLIRALIEERGVRVVAMETPRGRARALDGYLGSGDCDRPAAEVLSTRIFEVFSDDNTYALMRWICERNAATPGDPVRLFGFDIQQPDEDSAEIRTFVETWAADDAPSLLAGVASCFVLYSDPYPSEAEHAACVRGLDAIDAWVAAHEPELVATAGDHAVRSLRIAVVSYRAAEDAFFVELPDPVRTYVPRDAGMGAVFEGVLALDYPSDARVAIWAHNLHLARSHDRLVNTGFPAGLVTFGTVVGRAFGAAYAPVAITGYAPGTNWPQLDLVVEHTELGTSTDSVEVVLHRLGEPYLIVDPRAALLSLYAQPRLSEERMVPSEQYAAIVYLDSSPPMNAVFW